MSWASKRGIKTEQLNSIRMADSEAAAPAEATLAVLNKYMAQMTSLPAYKYSTFKKEIKQLNISGEADEIAHKLNLADLLALLSTSVDVMI